MRRASRIDNNHREIVQAFRKLGCSVLPLHTIGKGVPDLLVATGGRQEGQSMLIEIKAPKGRLNALQEEFRDNWLGKWAEVRTLDDVAEAVRRLRA